MPSFSQIFAALAATASLVSAHPTAQLSTRADNVCLTSQEGLPLANQFADLVGNYTPEKADRFLLADYENYSDGINSLRGAPLGSITFAGREAFKAAQNGHNGVPMVVDQVVAVTCDTVVWRWHATFGAAGKSVRGINVVKFEHNGGIQNGRWWIRRVDMEMNVLAYLENAGGNWTAPPRP